MLKRCTTILLVLILLIAFPAAGIADSVTAQKQLTIEEATELAIKNSRTLQKAELEIERTKEVRDAAADNVKFTPLGPTTKPAEMAFTGLLAADLGWRMASKAKTVEEDKIIASVLTEYNSVLEALADKEQAEKTYKYAQLQWTIGSLSNEIGMSSLSQRRIAEAGHKASKAGLEVANTKVEKAYQSFNQLIGLNSDEKPILISQPEYSSLEIDSLEREIYKATDHNPAIWLAEQKVSLANINLDLYNWSDPTREPYRAKEIDIQKAELDVSVGKQQTRDLMYRLYSSIRQLEEVYDLQEQQLLITEEKYNTQKLMYDVGMISKMDLLSAELDYDKAKNTFNKTVYQHELLKMAFNKPWTAATIFSAQGSSPDDSGAN
jgi:outer membrane protein